MYERGETLIAQPDVVFCLQLSRFCGDGFVVLDRVWPSCRPQKSICVTAVLVNGEFNVLAFGPKTPEMVESIQDRVVGSYGSLLLQC